MDFKIECFRKNKMLNFLIYKYVVLFNTQLIAVFCALLMHKVVVLYCTCKVQYCTNENNETIWNIKTIDSLILITIQILIILSFLNLLVK